MLQIQRPLLVGPRYVGRGRSSGSERTKHISSPVLFFFAFSICQLNPIQTHAKVIIINNNTNKGLTNLQYRFSSRLITVGENTKNQHKMTRASCFFFFLVFCWNYYWESRKTFRLKLRITKNTPSAASTFVRIFTNNNNKKKCFKNILSGQGD